MDPDKDAEQEEAMLRVRAIELRTIAEDIAVLEGTLAEKDLARSRGEIAEAIAAIEAAAAPYWATADRLSAIAVQLENAAFMSGTNAAGKPPLGDVQRRIAAWIDGIAGPDGPRPRHPAYPDLLKAGPRLSIRTPGPSEGD